MINPSANITGIEAIKNTWQRNSALSVNNPGSAETTKLNGLESQKSEFSKTVKAVGDYLSEVDNLQQSSETSVEDLLTGKNQDIMSVVSAVAKADMSFKLLVGVRNQLIEAYKQTMNMPL